MKMASFKLQMDKLRRVTDRYKLMMRKVLLIQKKARGVPKRR